MLRFMLYRTVIPPPPTDVPPDEISRAFRTLWAIQSHLDLESIFQALNAPLVSSYCLCHSVLGKQLRNVRSCLCCRTPVVCGWVVGAVLQFRSFIRDRKRSGGAILAVGDGELLVPGVADLPIFLTVCSVL